MDKGQFGIFISYRRADAAGYAGALKYCLQQRFPDAQVFRDFETIAAGRDFVDEIERGIRNADAVVCLIGQRWNHAADGIARLEQPDDHVAAEVAAALEKVKTVIPVLLEDTLMPAPQELPERVRKITGLNAAKLRDSEFEEDFEALATSLEQVRAGKGAKKLTGGEIVERFAAGEGAPDWVGRGGGLTGKAFKDDVATGSWKTQEYEVQFGGQLPSKNWFPAGQFVEKVKGAPT
ncbi:MAG: toll/interleukin-1 receptor domain-containing protein [Actinomycetota bacterium]